MQMAPSPLWRLPFSRQNSFRVGRWITFLRDALECSPGYKHTNIVTQNSFTIHCASILLNSPLAKCPAGFVSHSGLALARDPCLACPRGYFQPERGHSSCLLCPGGVRTPNKASTSVTHCEGQPLKTTKALSLLVYWELSLNY